MKTYIVQLEDHDDILSARDKISWSKANRVLLVWPRKARVLDRRVDLLLLQRFAQQSGLQLAIVAPSPEVKGYARELGVPVFLGPEQAQAANWRRLRRRKPAWQQRSPLQPGVLRDLRLAHERGRGQALLERINANRWLRLLFFTLGVAAFLVLVLFFVPGARVELKPVRKPQQLEIAVWASPKILAPNLTGGLPAYAISAVVEGHDQADSTGRSSIPDRAAVGEIFLNNLTDQPVDVPVGSIVVTLAEPPVRFETTLAVQVPPDPSLKVQVPIRALLPGKVGNVPAQAIRAMEGPLGLRVVVENPEPARGGTDRVSPAPDEADYQLLRDQLLADLRLSALEELRAKVAQEGRLLDETILLRQMVTEERYPPIGQPADRLQLTMQVEYEAWYVKEADLEILARAALDANRRPEDQPVPGSLRVDFVSQPVVDPGNRSIGNAPDTLARWQIQVQREVETHWQEAKVIESIRGQGVDEAVRILQSTLLLAEPPRIDLYPDWWVRLPFLPARIVLVQP